MKKIVILMMLVMLTVSVSAVMADENGGEKAGRLLLFQKCDQSLISKTVNGVTYDLSGCPNTGQGPWPIFSGNHMWGELEYSLWGPKFGFFFNGHNLSPNTDYTLIYYPDAWPGTGLICLGSGTTTSPSGNEGHGKWGHHGNWGQKGGDIKIYGNMDIGTSLPAIYDKNFNPIYPSGAVGAKIWLVLSSDVQCTNGINNAMLNWNPTAYLFEYNLIVYERQEVNIGEDFEKD